MDRLIKDRQQQIDRLKAKRKVLVKHKGGVKLSRAYKMTETTPRFPVRAESEVSYEHIMTRRDLELSALFLHKNFWWSLVVCCSALVTYFIRSLIVAFKPDNRTFEFMFVYVLAYIILFIDTAVSILSRWMKSVGKGREIETQSLVITLINLSLLLLPEVLLSFGYDNFGMPGIFLIALRSLMKIHIFFFGVYAVGIMHHTVSSALKYGLTTFYIFHTFVILWKFSCFSCKHYATPYWLLRRVPNIMRYNLDWVIKRKPVEPIPLSPMDAYILSCYHVIGAMANVGLDGASYKNSQEQIILITACLVGAFLIKGHVTNIVARILFDGYRVHYNHLLRLRLINQMLANNKIPDHIINEVAAFEPKYLKNKLIAAEPVLYNELPAPLKVEVCLDRYWYALKKSFFFERASAAMKEEIVTIMKTAIYNKGESIFEMGHPMHMMAFIARGSIDVLSVEDTETPLFTLGMGSCIGTLNLVYTRTAKFELQAASFCILHTLDKSDFWRYLKMKCKKAEAKTMFVNMANVKIRMARTSWVSDKSVNRITLMEAKKKLPVEEDIWEYNDATFNNAPYTKSKFCDIRMQDKIFIRTEWPWIFYPNTDVLKYWNQLQAFLVVLVAITYPFFICFRAAYTSPDLFIILQMTVSLFYLLDIIIQVLTAVEYNEEMVMTIDGILRVRLNSILFICELIAAIPTEIIYYTLLRLIKKSNYIRVFKLTKLLKLLKVPRYLSTFEKSCFGVNLLIMRTCKYFVYVFYTIYLMASFWYRYYCKEEVGCKDDSYIKTFLMYWETNSFYKLVISFLWITCPFTRSGESGVSTTADVYITIVLSFFGSFFFIYLSSDLYATKCITNLSKVDYGAMTENLITQMQSYNMNRISIGRIEEYLMLQWVNSNGIHEMDLIHDLPTFVQHDVMSARFLEILQDVPFFKNLDIEILQMLAYRVHTYFLPPKELATYEGQMVADFYMIEKGFIEVVCSNSNSVVKILGPKDSFCLLEMLLKKPSCFSYRASTHVSIMTLSRVQILIEVFSQYPILAYTIDKCVREIEQSTAVHRLFRHKEMLRYVKSAEHEEEKSWCIFSNEKRDPLCMDYDNQLQSKFAKRLCRLMMRRTILPSGKFILYYERFHAVMVFIMCMYIPLMQFYFIYWWGIFYFSIIFDLLQLLDIYIRLHVCYYNEKGILVLHPKSTAIHYLKTSFLVDLIAFIPFEKIFFVDIKYIGKGDTLHDNFMLLCYNRLLSMYRYRFLFYQKSKVAKTTFLKLLLYQLPILCLVLNVLSTWFLFGSTTLVMDDNGPQIVVKNGSWLNIQRNQLIIRNLTVYNIHIDSVYLITVMFFNCKFINLIGTPPPITECIIMSLMLLMGYFYFALLTANFLVVKAKMDPTVMLNKLYVGDMKVTLAKMNVKGLLKAIMNYFTLNSKRAQSADSRKTVAMFHDALQDDFMIRFHVRVLRKVPIFGDDAPQVSRILGRHFTDVYFPENSIIININDVVDFVYIIRKGEVKVTNVDNKYQTTLLTGSMFGNIDSVPYTRSMVKYECVEPVDLWCIRTELMYVLIKEIPFITARLNKHICLKCLSYVKNRAIMKKTALNVIKEKEVYIAAMTKWTRLARILASHRMEWMFIILAYFSAYWTAYIVAFRRKDFYNLDLGVFCFFDIICILQIIYNFYTPQYHYLGNIKQQKTAIKMYLKYEFPLMMMSWLPFEILLLTIAAEKYHYLQDFCRLNRLLKLVICYKFFKRKYYSMNTNIFVVECLWIFSQISLFVHGCACILFYISCPHRKCHNDAWVYKPRSFEMNAVTAIENICDNYYICSLYYASSILAITPFHGVRPNAIIDRLLFSIMIFCSSILHNLIVAQIFLMNKHFIFSSFIYIYNAKVLKKYLSFSMLSPRLLYKVYKYVFSLWVYCKGQQTPEFVGLLPTHLKTSYLMRLYGHHIYQNPLFELCHIDFTRQIVEKLKVQVYFDGHTICRQGEINETLYFIHKGVIEVCDINDTEIIVVDELWEGDTFGIVQGLFSCVPHNFTFVATSPTVLVTLTKSDWDYLLPFFPASEFFIYKHFNVAINVEDVQKSDTVVTSERSSDEDD